MARTNQNTNQQPPKEDIIPLQVPFAISYPNWAEDNSYCRFSLDLPQQGMTLHGMTLRYKQENGKETPMLLPPSYKGKNGKWYSHYYVKFSDEMVRLIVQQLENL